MYAAAYDVIAQNIFTYYIQFASIIHFLYKSEDQFIYEMFVIKYKSNQIFILVLKILKILKVRFVMFRYTIICLKGIY